MANSNKQAIREGKVGANIQQFQKDNQYKHYKQARYQSFTHGVGLVLGFLLLAILMINVVKFANGGKTITFSGLLNYLSTIQVDFKVPNLTTLTSYVTISGKWAILDGLRIFLNSLGSILGVVLYLGANLVYCITFLSKLLIYILG